MISKQRRPIEEKRIPNSNRNFAPLFCIFTMTSFRAKSMSNDACIFRLIKIEGFRSIVFQHDKDVINSFCRSPKTDVGRILKVNFQRCLAKAMTKLNVFI